MTERLISNNAAKVKVFDKKRSLTYKTWNNLNNLLALTLISASKHEKFIQHFIK